MPTILDSFPALDPAEAAAIGPFLTVQPGQLIRAADWNALQVQTRQEMARAAHFVQTEAARLGESVTVSQSATSAELAALRADILSLINGIPGEKIDPTSNLTIKHLRADDLSLGDWKLQANPAGHLQVGNPASPSRLVIDPTTTTLQGDLVVTGTVRSAGSEPKWSSATATSTTASQTGADLGSLRVAWTGTGRPTLALFKASGAQVDSASLSSTQVIFELIHRQQVRVNRPPPATHDPAGWTSLIPVPDGTLRIASRGGQTWAIGRSALVYRLLQGNWEQVTDLGLARAAFPGAPSSFLQAMDVSIAPDGTVYILGGTGAIDGALMRWEGGNNWTTFPMIGRRVVARSRTEVYVGNSDFNLFLSTDGGNSQQHLGGGIRDIALTASGDVLAQRVYGGTWNITTGTSTPDADSTNPAVFTTADALGPIQLFEDGSMTWQDGAKTVRTELFATHVAVDEQSRVFAIAPKGPVNLYTPQTATNPIDVNPIDLTHLDTAPVEVAGSDVRPIEASPNILVGRADIPAVDTLALADASNLSTRASLSSASVSLRTAFATAAEVPRTLSLNTRLSAADLGLADLTDLTVATDVLLDHLTTTENRDTVLARTTLDFSAQEYGQISREVQLVWMGALNPGNYTFLLRWRVANPTTVARVGKYGDTQLLLVTEL